VSGKRGPAAVDGATATVDRTPVYISTADLRAFLTRSGDKAGLRGDHLDLFVQGLLETDLRGIDSHGVFRIPFYCRGLASGKLNPQPALSRVRGRGATELIDADNGLGVIVGQLAMDRAVEMAREFGIGMVAVRNSNHSGMLAAHVLRATRAGMIGYFVSNSPALMAPWGGREALLSNSPFAWGIPSKSDPIILDMACSIVARGRIRLAAQRNERIPSSWAIDAHGMPVEDPHEAMQGVVLPMAGYKGYGIAFVNEIMSAILPGATLSMDVSRAFLREDATSLDSWGIGHVAVALDVTAFQDLDVFEAGVTHLADEMRGSALASGHQRIMVPGEPEAITRRARAVSGIPISPSVLDVLRAFSAEFDIEPPRLEDMDA
jgi:LDH2 family malate/lactate/ureidoglycolate dehydrogenase